VVKIFLPWSERGPAWSTYFLRGQRGNGDRGLGLIDRNPQNCQIRHVVLSRPGCRSGERSASIIEDFGGFSFWLCVLFGFIRVIWINQSLFLFHPAHDGHENVDGKTFSQSRLPLDHLTCRDTVEYHIVLD